MGVLWVWTLQGYLHSLQLMGAISQKHYLIILQFLFLPFSIFPEVESFCLVAV